jgi:tetratricopeptide (TPR) repeat protein
VYRFDSPSAVTGQQKIAHPQPKVQDAAALAPIPNSVPVEQVPVPANQNEGIQLESKQHVKQGMLYVSMAKQNKSTHDENIRNALTEFDLAVKAEEEKGHCYASAIMNRGIAYWADKKLNLAEKDLVRASECDQSSPVIFYNLASYYSSTNKVDLSLAPLDKALELGFTNCDTLMKDKDLANLRKLGDFKKTLEKHKVYCLR